MEVVIDGLEVQSFLAYLLHMVTSLGGLLSGDSQGAQFLRWCVGVLTVLSAFGIIVSLFDNFRAHRNGGRYSQGSSYEWVSDARPVLPPKPKVEELKDEIKQAVEVARDPLTEDEKGMFHHGRLSQLLAGLSEAEAERFQDVVFTDLGPDAWGMYYPASRMIALSKDLYGEPVEQIDTVFWHEYGHALDASGSRSRGTDFYLAWKRDGELVTRHMKAQFGEQLSSESLPYYDSPTEVFAEMYSLHRRDLLADVSPALSQYFQQL